MVPQGSKGDKVAAARLLRSGTTSWQGVTSLEPQSSRQSQGLPRFRGSLPLVEEEASEDVAPS